MAPEAPIAETEIAALEGQVGEGLNKLTSAIQDIQAANKLSSDAINSVDKPINPPYCQALERHVKIVGAKKEDRQLAVTTTSNIEDAQGKEQQLKDIQQQIDQLQVMSDGFRMRGMTDSATAIDNKLKALKGQQQTLLAPSSDIASIVPETPGKETSPTRMQRLFLEALQAQVDLLNKNIDKATGELNSKFLPLRSDGVIVNILKRDTHVAFQEQLQDFQRQLALVKGIGDTAEKQKQLSMLSEQIGALNLQASQKITDGLQALAQYVFGGPKEFQKWAEDKGHEDKGHKDFFILN